MAFTFNQVSRNFGVYPTPSVNVHQSDLSKFGKYSDLAAANPYANVDYRQSIWQKLLSNLGFRTDYDSYLESMSLNAKEYEASLLEKKHNEEYDSAASQAERLRQAGLNPDLQNVDAGGSSGMEPDPSLPAQPGNDQGLITNIAGTLVSSVETLFGLAESGFGLASLAQDIESKRLANDKSRMENTLEAFLGASLPDDYNQGSNSDGTKWHWRFGWNKDSRLYSLLGSRARKYARGVNLYRESLLGQEAEAEHRAGRAANRSLFARLRGKSTYSELNDVLDAFEGTLGDLATIQETTRQEADIKKSQYEGGLADAMDPERMAEATMQGAEASAQESAASAFKLGAEGRMADAREKAKNSLDSLTAELDKLAGDNFLARLGAVLVNLIKIRVFQL